jgi:hypothetical protein
MTSSVGISPFLPTMTWILGTVWEVLILCLAVWIAVKHFRELRQHSTSGIVGDCVAVLMKSHVSFFARWAHKVNAVLLFRWSFAHLSFLAISCFEIGFFSSTLSAVCGAITDPYMWPWSIIPIEHRFPGRPDLSWSRSDTPGRADVCAGTTPNPRYSRISRWARGQLWYSNGYDFNCFPGAYSCVN